MARGLSDTQKKILAVINDLPPRILLYPGIYNKLKAKLYPELYTAHGDVMYYGQRKDETNCARVTLSRSLHRLEKRGLIVITPYVNNAHVYITQSGKEALSVNEIDKHDFVNQ